MPLKELSAKFASDANKGKQVVAGNHANDVAILDYR